MLREPARLIAYRRLLVDAFLTAASFLLAHQLRAHVLPRVVPALFPAGIYPLTDYLPLLVVALALWVFLLAGQRSGSVDVFSLRSEVKRVLRAVALGVRAARQRRLPAAAAVHLPPVPAAVRRHQRRAARRCPHRRAAHSAGGAGSSRRPSTWW